MTVFKTSVTQLLTSSYGQYVHLTLHKNGTIENIRDQLEKRGFINPEIRHITPNIEDCFMDLMIKQ